MPSSLSTSTSSDMSLMSMDSSAFSKRELPTLETIPPEMLQCIGNELDDRDLCNLLLVCKATHWKFQDASWWAVRFASVFDKPPVGTYKATALGVVYKTRRKVLRKGAIFKSGLTANERACLNVLIPLCLEANPTLDEDGIPTSKNLREIKKFNENHGILRNVMRHFSRGEQPEVSLEAVRLLLTPIFLERVPTQIAGTVYGVEESQFWMYASPIRQPLFKGRNDLDVNIRWALHCTNFFKNHLIDPEERTLHDAFAALPNNQVPTFWKKRLADQPAKLGNMWNGTYAYLDRPEVDTMRLNLGGNHVFIDRNVDNGADAIQIMKLWESDGGSWSNDFEQHLSSKKYEEMRTSSPNTRQRYRRLSEVCGVDKHFSGIGYDDENFWCEGWLNPLPAQQGIPGWQRFTMMKFFLDEKGTYDSNALWAYEGIVLPGSQVIVGRWWAPELSVQNKYSGPFIFWNVDGAYTPEERDWKQDHRGLNPHMTAAVT